MCVQWNNECKDYMYTSYQKVKTNKNFISRITKLLCGKNIFRTGAKRTGNRKSHFHIQL